MKRIYVCGGISGYKDLNFPAFDNAEKLLTKQGWEVISPASEDRRLYPNHDWNTGHPANFNYTDILVHDIKLISTCQAIYLLDGWEKSPGALAEFAFAKAIKLEFIFQMDCSEYRAKKWEIGTFV